MVEIACKKIKKTEYPGFLASSIWLKNPLSA